MTGIEQFRYDDKRVLVVGGATGMGAAAAKMAKELGAEVVVLDYAPVSYPVDRALTVDLRDPASIDSAIDEVGGPVNAIFSAAGVADGPDLMRINFIGHRHLIERMLDNDQLPRGSAICFISSLAGLGWENDLPRIQEFLATPDYKSAEEWVAAHEAEGVIHYGFSKQVINADVAVQSFPEEGRADQRDLPRSHRYTARPGQRRPLALLCAGLPRGDRQQGSYPRRDGQRDGVSQQRCCQGNQRRESSGGQRARDVVHHRIVRTGQVHP